MNSPPTSVVEAFLRRAEQVPGSLCLIFEGTRVTYAELKQQIEQCAQALLAWGVQPGERIALFMHNTPEFVALYFGAHLARAVIVPVNTEYRRVELCHMFRDAGVRLCFTTADLRPELEQVRADLPELDAIIETGPALDAFLSSGGRERIGLPSGDDLAAIAYTSGTTGRSKGAMILHRNQIANIQAVIAAWRWAANDCLLLALPLFHVHGLMVGIHGTLVSGGSVELHRGFNADIVYNSLQVGPATMFFGVPTMYTRLLSRAGARAERSARELRLFVSGSAPLSPQTFAVFEQVFGQRILERYGMTETLMNLTNPYEGERKPGTVGMPFPGQQARVVDVRTRVELPPDTDGEIEVAGPHVFKGYWNQPEATAQRFTADGWFRTGDLGHVGHDGYYTITGRASELIISGGYNVYPREVEEVLERCPGVAEVAVLGVYEADLGEQVVAAIVRNDPTLTADTVVAFCREHLASYKKPRRVVFMDALPRNALGKLQKHLLREQFETTE